jgi:CBS-domain-containing membrane protein
MSARDRETQRTENTMTETARPTETTGGERNRRTETTSKAWWNTPEVADIMTRTVVTAKADTLLPALVDDMVRYGVSGIPIVDAESRLLGIVTEADLMSKVAFGGTHHRSIALLGDLLRGREQRARSKSEGVSAAEIMTTRVETARPHDSVRAAARRMIAAGVKRLPVLDDDRLVGIVSRSDVLNSMHRNDDELQGEINAALQDPTRIPEEALVTASVTDGVVTLTGTVQFALDLPVLSSIVWRFPGVVDIRNEVTTQTGSGGGAAPR